jgi:hypothetical protein
MTRTALWVGLVSISAVANPVAAQDLRPAVFGTAGVTNVYRTEDQRFGTELEFGFCAPGRRRDEHKRNASPPRTSGGMRRGNSP